jgi:predicted ATP-dependent endonuclease of OLD family
MKPVAFRIKDFKSIVDTGICHLSTDGITVLAGENESGKTAILSALRDFNLPSGVEPQTTDFVPDDDFEKKPTVSVCFEVNWNELFAALQENSCFVLPRMKEELKKGNLLWVTRDLIANEFSVDEQLSALWERQLQSVEAMTDEEYEKFQEGIKDEEIPSEDATWDTPNEFATALYRHWPIFVYFSTFDDILPRTVKFSLLQPTPIAAKTAVSAGTDAATSKVKGPDAPQIVKDFLKLAGVDLDRVSKIINNDKLLTNYLDKCNGQITGDFLSFWKRTSEPSRPVKLRVGHYRDEDGELFLTFYVHDTSNQHHDQRSRGFLWFLSFYLRLAASRASDGVLPNLLLIDEPGSFLHARAQRDVLSLFEKRLIDRDSVIYSTHSPYLIPADRLYRLKVVIKTADNGTHIADKLSDSELSSDEFSDTLSPILTAIGIDIREQLKFVGKSNIVVEGLSDYLYLHAWLRLWPDSLPEKASIFPGTGASTTILLSSLFIGWGLDFIVALDNDQEGHETRKQLIRDMGIHPDRIVQQKDGAAIEDLISPSDFNLVLASLNSAYKLDTGEKPGKALKRLKISKPIAAKQFAELFSPGKNTPTKATQEAIAQLMKQCKAAFLTAD